MQLFVVQLVICKLPLYLCSHLRQQCYFLPCYENGLINTISRMPYNLYAVSRQHPFSDECDKPGLALSHNRGKSTKNSHICCGNCLGTLFVTFYPVIRTGSLRHFQGCPTIYMQFQGNIPFLMNVINQD